MGKMPPMAEPRSPAGDASFRLGDWLVEPTLNRLSRGDEAARIEPKLMDVLRLLAERPGVVLSKDEIADAVWSDTFITESVITRAIAGLRKALHDDARAPRFIETIAKRGYRLLVTPEPETSAPPAVDRAAAAPSPPPLAAGGYHQPYAIGQWVRGERFYGRSAELREILHGPRNGVWVLGARAMGKTSLLRQLEHMTMADEAYFPLYWDLQGSVEPDEAHEDFQGALADTEPRLEALGIAIEKVAADDFLLSLGRLRRALRAQGRTLLLLWDEVEELLHLHARWPALLRKLRRALLSQEGMRTVIASGPRLWKLAEQRDDTSPFLHGFAPPLYLGPLAKDAARSLVLQRQSPGLAGREAEAPFRGETVDRMLELSGGHPTLLQLLCRRTVELGEVEAAARSVAADPTIGFFFAVDFDLLTPLEQQILVALASAEEPIAIDRLELEAPSAELQTASLHLQRLGALRLRGTSAEPMLEIRSPLHRRWLARRSVEQRSADPAQNV